MKIKFLALTNGKNIGDDNNAIVVASRALKEFTKSYNQDQLMLDVLNTAGMEIDVVMQRINADQVNHIFLIGAGEHQLKYFEINVKVKITAIWLSHQPCSFMEKAFKYVDYFALPKALLEVSVFQALGLDYNIFEGSKKLLPLELIPHDKTLDGIKVANERWPEKFSQEKNIICLLGGDAPLPGGQEFQFFTKKEAEGLASKIVKKAIDEGRFIYVTNGPRTGLFDDSTGQKREVHKEDSHIDAVTASFIDQLQRDGLIESKNFQFFDFKFLAAGGVSSALAPLYYHAITTDSYLYLPGESISSISEVITLGLGGVMEIYTTGSMNLNHHQFVDNLKGKDLTKIPNPVDEVANYIYHSAAVDHLEL
jgi:hypothetical protein